jgi:hypothetical protein
MSEPDPKPSSKPDTVSFYVDEFQKRFVEFERGRQEELRMLKHDFVARLFNDHVVLGDKQTYDALLQGMLNEQEQERLETDPHFTQAWRIFVDLCWLKKQLIRTALILGGIVVVMGIILFCIFALPHVAGPQGE